MVLQYCSSRAVEVEEGGGVISCNGSSSGSCCLGLATWLHYSPGTTPAYCSNRAVKPLLQHRTQVDMTGVVEASTERWCAVVYCAVCCAVTWAMV